MKLNFRHMSLQKIIVMAVLTLMSTSSMALDTNISIYDGYLYDPDGSYRSGSYKTRTKAATIYKPGKSTPTNTTVTASVPNGYKPGSWYYGYDKNSHVNTVDKDYSLYDNSPLFSIGVSWNNDMKSHSYAIFHLRTAYINYSLSYDANGGTGTLPSAVSDLTIVNSFTLANPSDLEKTGYTWSGIWTTAKGTESAASLWISKSNAAVQFDLGNADTNVTLFAKWNVNHYTAIIDGESTNVAYDAAFQVPDPTAATGHPFADWKIVDFDASTAEYSYDNANWVNVPATGIVPKSSATTVYFRNLTPTDGATVTLTSQYSINHYWAVIDGVSTNVAYGAPFSVIDPTRLGYTFSHWVVSNFNASKAQYSNDNDNATWVNVPTTGIVPKGSAATIYFRNLTTIDGATVTLASQYTTNRYEVVVDGVSTNIAYDSSFGVTNDSRVGYTFSHWSVSGFATSTAQYSTDNSSWSKISDTGIVPKSSATTVYFLNLNPTNDATVTLTSQYSTNHYWVVVDGVYTNVAYGASFSVPNPTQLGYTFSHWVVSNFNASKAQYSYDNDNDNATWVNVPDTGIVPKGSAATIYFRNLNPIDGAKVTMTSQFAANEYVVKINDVPITNLAYDAEICVNDPVSNGYSFVGWGMDGVDFKTAQYRNHENDDWKYLSGLTPPYKGNVTTNIWFKNLTPSDGAAVTLTNCFTANVYTATLICPGCINNPTTKLEVKFNDQLPVITTIPEYPTGYRFLGYYTSTNGLGELVWDEKGEPAPSGRRWLWPSNMTFYAYKFFVERDVHYNSKGGVPNDIHTNMVVGTTINKFPEVAWENGYRLLVGWFDSQSNQVYAEYTQVPYGGGSWELYADWTNAWYSISYNGNGAETGSMPAMNVQFCTDVTLSANAFTKGGYAFAGWATNETDAAAQIVAYGDCATVNNIAPAANTTVTLYAVWKKDLTPISEAMKCYNLKWTSSSENWFPTNATSVGYGSDSAASSINSEGAQIKLMSANAATNGVISFWWKSTVKCSIKNPLNPSWYYDHNTFLPFTVNTYTNSVLVNSFTTNLVGEANTWYKCEYAITNAASSVDFTLGYYCNYYDEDYGQPLPGTVFVDQMKWVPGGSPVPPPPPTEPASVRISGDKLVIGYEPYTPDPGYSYHLLCTDSLDPAKWYDYGPTNLGDAASSFEVPIDNVHTSRFFKIETLW